MALYRIASNHCLDYLRKHRLDQVSLDRPLTDDSDSTLQDKLEAPASDSPENLRESVPSEAAALLDRLWIRIKGSFCRLGNWKGIPYEELAEMLQDASQHRQIASQ